MNFICKLSLIFLLFSSYSTRAEPWVDTSNLFLRANIQHLADVGIIKTPTTTFPLMWHDIARDIGTVFPSQYSDDTQQALNYVKHQLKLAKRSQKSLSLNAAAENKRFTSFGDDFRDKNNLSASTTFVFDKVAARIQTSYTNSPLDDDQVRFDGSYAAFFLGNWVFSAGMQDRWWGPGWDTSLSFTNNARPIPALALSRKSAIPVTIPWTDIKIPWTVTTFMGKLNDERYIKNTSLWGFRMNFNPAPNWEIGVTRLAQWAGDNRPRDFDTFLDILKGFDNCGNGVSFDDCKEGKEPGNQQAGYDIRWSTSLFQQPIAVAFTAFAEDGDDKGGLSILGEEQYQVSIETQIQAFDYYWKVYLEGTDTYAKCRDGRNGDGTSTIGDCYYEHHIYQTGMRYNKRSIGSLYDNDASTLVLGAISQSDSNTQFEFKLRWLQLNKDNHDKAPSNPIIGNTLTRIAEDMIMLSGKAQHSYKNWRFTVGTDISRSEFDNELKTQNDVNVFAKVEYNL